MICCADLYCGRYDTTKTYVYIWSFSKIGNLCHFVMVPLAPRPSRRCGFKTYKLPATQLFFLFFSIDFTKNFAFQALEPSTIYNIGKNLVFWVLELWIWRYDAFFVKKRGASLCPTMWKFTHFSALLLREKASLNAKMAVFTFYKHQNRFHANS